MPSRFGLLQQGVAGLFVAPGYASDIPGQLWAQLAGLAGVLALALGVPLLVFGLIRAAQAVARWTRPDRRTVAYRARKR